MLALMATDGRMVDSLIDSVARVTDSETLTTLVMALGAMKSRESIPCLARILGAPGIDTATARAAVMSLGVLTNRQFELSDDPRSSALDWLQLNGYRSVPMESEPASLPSPESSALPGDLVHIQVHAPLPDESLKVVEASVVETWE